MSVPVSPPSSGKSAELHAIATPEKITAPWGRYANPLISGDFYHFITNWNASGSVTTACRGRWATTETSVASTSPAHADRCEACSEYAIDRAQVNRGLRELAANAPHERFDLGGES